ncbi:hypothetical protein O6P43_008258 [Quillaja saponaria]|uniref:Uncharacterized protein n=1 Tax=Quillaja saponaria TaxID=32244 RepID=A0AAD7PWJ5_QUISA|nr:hypothetical protein O6P43_008258 [Quillaja saponaria]
MVVQRSRRGRKGAGKEADGGRLSKGEHRSGSREKGYTNYEGTRFTVFSKDQAIINEIEAADLVQDIVENTINVHETRNVREEMFKQGKDKSVGRNFSNWKFDFLGEETFTMGSHEGNSDGIKRRSIRSKVKSYEININKNNQVDIANRSFGPNGYIFGNGLHEGSTNKVLGAGSKMNGEKEGSPVDNSSLLPHPSRPPDGFTQVSEGIYNISVVEETKGPRKEDDEMDLENGPRALEDARVDNSSP